MKTVNITGVPFSLPQFCLGTAFFGNGKVVSKESSFELMDYFYRHGGCFFNTAHEYGRGRSEMCLGEWISQRGLARDQFILTTKGGQDVQKARSVAMHREDLLEDIDESLQRLRVDYVDFFLLHLDDPMVSVEEIVCTMEEIRRAGKTRYYGCSNWMPERQRLARKFAEQQGYQGFVLDEIEYSIARSNRKNGESNAFWLDDSFEVLHEEDGVCVGAYAALSHGVFTKYLENGNFRNSGGYSAENGWYQRFTNPYNLEIARRLKQLSEETGWSVIQLQLAWLADKPRGFPCFSIFSADNVPQLKESMGADNITLTKDMIDFLTVDRREFPDGLDLQNKGIAFPFGLE